MCWYVLVEESSSQTKTLTDYGGVQDRSHDKTDNFNGFEGVTER